VHMGALWTAAEAGKEKTGEAGKEAEGRRENMWSSRGVLQHTPLLCEARRCSVPGQQGQIYAHLDRTLTPPFLLTIFAMY